MKLFDEQMKPLDRDKVDLSKGYLRQITIIKEDVVPIDNKKKFAWADDDYEKAEKYILNKEHIPTPDEDRDAMLVDMEMRLTLLELDVINNKL